MRRAAAFLAVLAVGASAFAAWGLFTAAGARHFDEMAGMIPFFAGVASAPLGLAAAALWWRRSRRR